MSDRYRHRYRCRCNSNQAHRRWVACTTHGRGVIWPTQAPSLLAPKGMRRASRARCLWSCLRAHTPHEKKLEPATTCDGLHWCRLLVCSQPHMTYNPAHRMRGLGCPRHHYNWETHLLLDGSIVASLWGVWRVVNTSFPHTSSRNGQLSSSSPQVWLCSVQASRVHVLGGREGQAEPGVHLEHATPCTVSQPVTWHLHYCRVARCK